MTDSFNLIKRLHTTKLTHIDNSIKYNQFDIIVEGKNCTVDIPIKETEEFKQILDNHKEPITRQTLRTLLRHFRGVKNITQG